MTAVPADPPAPRTSSWTSHRSGSPPVDELLRVLAITPERGAGGELIFQGTSASRPPDRVFGGQMLAQAAVAASLTVDQAAVVHSLHAYFVRAGRPDVPFRFRVEPVRDGRSFRIRRVDALQDDLLVCTVTASFHAAQDGIRHQDPMPDFPGPDELAGHFAFPDSTGGAPSAVEMRPCPPIPMQPARPEWAVWLRVAAALPDDPLLHRALLIYLSDLGVLRGAFRIHRLDRGGTASASLDHTIWLHGQARADDWMLYRSRSPWSGHGRAVGNAALFAASGELLAHTGQEMVIRPRRRRHT
jgi:acyl-CoA thioesterase-2